MEMILTSTYKYVDNKIERDLHWYDPYEKKMLSFRGGELKFRYDPIKKRSVPYVDDVRTKIKTNNMDEIQNWISQNKNKYGITILHKTDRNFIVDIDAMFISDIEEELYRAGILCNYSVGEMKRELNGKTQSRNSFKSSHVSTGLNV